MLGCGARRRSHVRHDGKDDGPAGPGQASSGPAYGLVVVSMPLWSAPRSHTCTQGSDQCTKAGKPCPWVGPAPQGDRPAEQQSRRDERDLASRALASHKRGACIQAECAGQHQEQSQTRCSAGPHEIPVHVSEVPGRSCLDQEQDEKHDPEGFRIRSIGCDIGHWCRRWRKRVWIVHRPGLPVGCVAPSSGWARARRSISPPESGAHSPPIPDSLARMAGCSAVNPRRRTGRIDRRLRPRAQPQLAGGLRPADASAAMPLREPAGRWRRTQWPKEPSRHHARAASSGSC